MNDDTTQTTGSAGQHTQSASQAPTSAPAHVQISRDGKQVSLEYQLVAPERTERPLIVFLHEGLGCIDMWRDWPTRLCEAANCRGVVFSRYGYGKSTPREKNEVRWPDYLHKETRETQAVLQTLGFDKAPLILFGHSDGGSIALLYAAMYPESVRAIAVAAPHIFVEDVTVQGIRDAVLAYNTTDLPQRLARYHRDVDSVFHAWTDTWQQPEFLDWNIEREIERIRCPVLAMQGVDDQYGTLEQVRGIGRRVTNTRVVEIPECGHSPHKDQPEVVAKAFLQLLDDLNLSAVS